MENKEKVKKILNIVNIVVMALLFICLLTPGLKVKIVDPESTTKFSMFDFYGANASVSTSGTISSEFNSFFAILVAMIGFIPSLCFFSKKGITRLFGFSIMLVFFAYFVYLVDSVNAAKDILEATLTTNGVNFKLSNPGPVFGLIALIIELIMFLVDIVYTQFFDEVLKIIDWFKNRNKSLVKLLEENKVLLDKGLITKEEFEDRKKNLLKGGK